MTASTPDSATPRNQHALLVGVVTTAASLIPTAYVASISNSTILFADLLRCAVEFAAIVVAWIIVRKISQSDRSQFNYGFGKLEQLSSIFVAIAMLCSFFVVLFAAVRRIVDPHAVHSVALGLGLGVLSVLGNGIMWLYYLRLSRTAASPVMDSQWRLFRAKTGTSSIVVLSLLPNLFSGMYGWLSLTDPLGSIVVAGFLLHSAFSLLTSSMKELVDSSIEEVLQLLVLRTLVKHADTYLGFRGIRSRRVVSKVFLEISLEFKAQITMEQFEGVASVLRKELQAVIPGVDVTIVPFAVGVSEGPRATS